MLIMDSTGQVCLWHALYCMAWHALYLSLWLSVRVPGRSVLDMGDARHHAIRIYDHAMRYEYI